MPANNSVNLTTICSTSSENSQNVNPHLCEFLSARPSIYQTREVAKCYLHNTPESYHSLLFHFVTAQVHPSSEAPVAHCPLDLPLSATHQYLSADFGNLYQFTAGILSDKICKVLQQLK